MSTKLENEVTRETALTVDDREVEITLVPMNVGTLEPEALHFHLKGLTSKHDKVVPLHLLLRALGWKVKLGAAIRPQANQGKLTDVPGVGKIDVAQLVADLERTFGKAQA